MKQMSGETEVSASPGRVWQALTDRCGKGLS